MGSSTRIFGLVFAMAFLCVCAVVRGGEGTPRDTVVLKVGGCDLRIKAVADNILRFTYTRRERFLPENSLMVLSQKEGPDLRLKDAAETAVLSTGELKLTLDKKTGGFSVSRGGAELAEFPGVELKEVETPGHKVYKNGKDVVEEVEPIIGDGTGRGCSGKLLLKFAPDEAIYGLGQHEEGYFNFRGKKQFLYQHNLKIAMPVFISSRGYGVFFDTYAYSIFNDETAPSFFWTEAVDEFDFYFIAGPDFDRIVAGMRRLTGAPTLFPAWAYGYIQSKERYKTQDDLISTAEEFRKRGIPLDCIVQDWRYWTGGWGEKHFDPKRFPDMKSGIERLHSLHIKLMISIWPLMKGKVDGREMREAGCMLSQGNYDAFSGKARRLYWKQAYEGLYKYGVDAWWADCTEPVTSDWGAKAGKGGEAPFASQKERAEKNVAALRDVCGVEYLNAYSLVHTMGLYENQLEADPEKRVVILTRSAYPGQQRYGGIPWSGDTTAKWTTLKAEIAKGLSFTVTGYPKWTDDCGAFFVSPNKRFYFRKGDFPGGCHNKGYAELYTRWFQFATFLPMMRSHGTHTPREPWFYKEAGQRFYNTLLAFDNLRHRLFPYNYSNAAAETFENYTSMRMLAFDFRTDAKALNVKDEFMFGPAFLVAPVTSPMYYGSDGKPLPGDAPKTRSVYLPAGAEWYDFWSGRKYEGGRTVEIDAPLEKPPLFVRAGSIVPMGPFEQYVGEKSDAPWEIRVYPGRDASFKVYEDAGEGHGYLKGERAVFTISWDDGKRVLTFSKRNGAFKGMRVKRGMDIVVVGEGKGCGIEPSAKPDKKVDYAGEELKVPLK